MPRRDDDEFDEDDRPRRRRRDDDEDDRPARRRRRRDDEDDYAPPRRKKGNLGLILGIVGGVLILVCGGGGVGAYFLFKGATARVGEAAERLNSANNMKQIGLAVHSYADRLGELPNNSYGPDGKPLLSWRVHILPYLGEQALYNQFHLDEPWDSPNNKPLLARMPRAYATPAEGTGKVPLGTQTYYRGFSSPGAIFAKRNPGHRLGMMNVTDGLSNTILVVEAGLPTEWTKPDDMDAAPGKPFPALGGIRPTSDTVMVLFCDGSVRPLRRSLPEVAWRAGITYAGGEIVNFD